MKCFECLGARCGFGRTYGVFTLHTPLKVCGVPFCRSKDSNTTAFGGPPACARSVVYLPRKTNRVPGRTKLEITKKSGETAKGRPRGRFPLSASLRTSLFQQDSPGQARATLAARFAFPYSVAAIGTCDKRPQRRARRPRPTLDDETAAIPAERARRRGCLPPSRQGLGLRVLPLPSPSLPRHVGSFAVGLAVLLALATQVHRPAEVLIHFAGGECTRA